MVSKIQNCRSKLFLTLLSISHVWANSKLVSLTLKTEEESAALTELADTDEDIDLWKRSKINSPIQIRINDNATTKWSKFLKSMNLEETVIIPNLDKYLVKDAKIAVKRKRFNKKSTGDLTWDEYSNLEEIDAFITKLPKKYSKLCKIYIIGKTVENRPMKVLRISSGKSATKKAVFLDSLIHSREFIAGAFSTYVINELTLNSGEYKHLLDILDFYFLPIFNPDGYAFAHEDLAKNRLWRKNRRTFPGAKCVGVDLNRNFGYHWNEAKEKGSQNPCSQSYAGSGPFSEPEGQAVRDFILKEKTKHDVKWYFYFSIHSYGNCWTSSFSYKFRLPKDDADLQKIGKCATQALTAVHGTKATYGNSAKIMGSALAGVTDDWAKGVVGFKYSTTIELRDNGTYGFLLPPAQIIPTAEEAWAGLQMALTECRTLPKGKVADGKKPGSKHNSVLLAGFGAGPVKKTKPGKKQPELPLPDDYGYEWNLPADNVDYPGDDAQPKVHPPSRISCPSGKVQCSCSGQAQRKTKDTKDKNPAKPKGRVLSDSSKSDEENQNHRHQKS